MQFDVVATNPPFQDYTNKKKTQHKLWIDFTRRAFDKWLKPEGILLQVSPSSFLSPSSKILKLMQEKDVKYLRLDTKKYFSKVGFMLITITDPRLKEEIYSYLNP